MTSNQLPTEQRPYYMAMPQFDNGQLWMVCVDEGWRTTVLCSGMYQWAAEWLADELQGKPCAPGRRRAIDVTVQANLAGAFGPTTSDEILATPLDENDADAATVRDYLIALLVKVWQEERNFDGKRPFGNSGWQHDLYAPLIKAGCIEGTLDENGYGDVASYQEADALIIDAIKALGGNTNGQQ